MKFLIFLLFCLKIVLTLTENDNFSFFVKFARLPYCEKNQIESLKCKNCKEIEENGFKVLSIDSSSLNGTDYKLVILLNEKENKILISFSGPKTEKVKEIAKIYKKPKFISKFDLNIEKDFYDAYISLRKTLIQRLLEINTNENLKINKHEAQYIFIGHFFGGALAELAAYELFHSQILMNPTLIYVYTYGALRIGTADSIKKMQEFSPNIVKVRRKEDLLPRIPYCPIDYEKKVFKCYGAIDKLVKDNKDLGEYFEAFSAEAKALVKKAKLKKEKKDEETNKNKNGKKGRNKNENANILGDISNNVNGQNINNANFNLNEAVLNGALANGGVNNHLLGINQGFGLISRNLVNPLIPSGVQVINGIPTTQTLLNQFNAMQNINNIAQLKPGKNNLGQTMSIPNQIVPKINTEEQLSDSVNQQTVNSNTNTINNNGAPSQPQTNNNDLGNNNNLNDQSSTNNNAATINNKNKENSNKKSDKNNNISTAANQGLIKESPSNQQVNTQNNQINTNNNSNSNNNQNNILLPNVNNQLQSPLTTNLQSNTNVNASNNIINQSTSAINTSTPPKITDPGTFGPNQPDPSLAIINFDYLKKSKEGFIPNYSSFNNQNQQPLRTSSNSTPQSQVKASPNPKRSNRKLKSFRFMEKTERFKRKTKHQDTKDYDFNEHYISAKDNAKATYKPPPAPIQYKTTIDSPVSIPHPNYPSNQQISFYNTVLPFPRRSAEYSDYIVESSNKSYRRKTQFNHNSHSNNHSFRFKQLDNSFFNELTTDPNCDNSNSDYITCPFNKAEVDLYYNIHIEDC